MRDFEHRAKQAGIPMEQIRPSHYALCATIDDLVLNTPWGSAIGWGAASLTATFHREARAGDQFFDQLERLSRNPAPNLPTIELMYLCLSLGFMGRYRRSPGGADAA